LSILKTSGGGSGTRQANARIAHCFAPVTPGRVRYDLAVTDPVWLDRLKPLPAGLYPHAHFFKEKHPRPLLTLSLSELFDGFHYKLVAGVVALPA